MKGNDKVNELYNMIREAMKMDDADKRGEAIAAIVSELAKSYETARHNSSDVEFMNVAHFAGFSTIALMYGAVADDESKENMMNFVIQVVGTCANAMSRAEGTDAA